ncbi:DUF2935 domain-containing protein [Rossellomorea vietnamensis]|uniref:DUF2935 domain-containing protein n=1 Tax=Rossellomorea vietnamensis TaxID=218284 RepID=UPI003CE7EF8B
MNREGFEEKALYEHRFWLQILGDHARFIRDTLSPLEKEEINRAEQFIVNMDQLLEMSRQPLSGQKLEDLTSMAAKQTEKLRTFKLSLVRKKLTGKVVLGLGETFINHMVNELEEYIKILDHLLKNEEVPDFHPVHHHLLWLADAAGHAGAINDSLDLSEKKLKEQGTEFQKDFEAFYLKAIELAGYMRTGLLEFPALTKFNEDVELEMKIFKSFLDELEEWEMNNKLLGSFSALMADHMGREECYYLIKLYESAGTQLPECDPTAPRVKA